MIKEIYAEVDEDNAQLVSSEFTNSIQAIMMDLGNKLTPELSQEVASVYNLNAKFAFYNVCFNKAHEILNKVDPKLASVFNAIQETNVLVVSRFTHKLLSLHPTIADLIQRLEEVEQEKPRGHFDADPAETEALRKEIDRLREEQKYHLDKISKQGKELDRLKKGEAAPHRGHTFEENRERDVREQRDLKKSSRR